MTESRVRQHWAITLVSGLAGVAIAHLLAIPLPWLNGALIGVMLVRLSGARCADIPGGRQIGLWLISTAIGLHFDAEVLAAIVAEAEWVLFGIMLTLSMGGIGIFVLTRAGYDAATVFFASMPGGASEMATMSASHGGREDLVALAHTLRLALIVLIVPALCFALSPDRHQVASVSVDSLALSIVLPAGLLAAFLGSRLGILSPWMLAPVVVVASLTASAGFESSLPSGLQIIAQLLIGCSLGCRFDRYTLAQAPRFAAFSVFVSLLAIGSAWGLAFVLGFVTSIPIVPWLLGIMPGGIAEMTLTAQMLGQGVAFVTAIQVLRLIAVMVIAGPWFRLLARRRSRHS